MTAVLVVAEKMGKSQLSFLILAGFLSVALGWESESQYVYKYKGRSVSGINRLDEQHAILELKSRVIVQAHDEDTISVKLDDIHIKRNGKHMGNPHFPKMRHRDDLLGGPEEIEGEEDRIENLEQLQTPFIITHKKGSVVALKVGNDEPHWVINLKKSIASQLQLDTTGVRPDGMPLNWVSSSEETNKVLTVFEDGITGDCSTTIQINLLPHHQVHLTEAFDLGLFDVTCEDKKIYEIVKTKDFNRCISNPIYYSVSQPIYTCTLGTANCGDAMQRTSTMKYIGCGESLDKLTIVHALGYNNFIVKPFGVQTEDMTSSVITEWTLESKDSVRKSRSELSNPIELKSLSYVFGEFEHDLESQKYIQPSLTEAHLKRNIDASDIKRTILESLKTVINDLKENPDSEKDNIERLVSVGGALPMFSLDELRSLWEEVKHEDHMTKTLFVDCVVQAGSNPTIMLIKELIEKQEIKGEMANWAVAALGYYAKTPTSELLLELMKLLKSSTLQSNKMLRQTAMMMVADLVSTACESPFLRQKKYAVELLGDFCEEKDSIMKEELLPILERELKVSGEGSAADKIIALTAIGYLGIEEIIPVLLPHIEGRHEGDDTAERTRAILSLHRVMYSKPEKVHPLLTALAGNVGERPEVRMAAISMLLTSNAPLVIWQKLASRTWFDPSRQVSAFVNSILNSFSNMPPSSHVHKELAQKASVAITIARPTPFGLPYSSSDIRSSYMEDEQISVMMHTPIWRVSDEHWPVAMGNRYFYQLGPFTSSPLQVFLWNYNMSDIWKHIANLIYGKESSDRSVYHKGESRQGEELNLSKIWEELNVSRRPVDKRAGVVHINLMGSINRMFDLEEIYKEIPNWLAKGYRSQSQPMEISLTKYRMLAELKIRIPTEMGFPLRYLATLPVLVSTQGVIKVDEEGGLKTDLRTEMGLKLSSEVRVEIPFNGNHVAIGVDCRTEIRTPKELHFSYKKGQLKTTWIPGSKVTDLLYYHVKPYTITRNIEETDTPTLEDSAVNIISSTEKPFKLDVPLAGSNGINLRAMVMSELGHNDHAAVMKWLKKWDVNGFSNLGFVPLSLDHRQLKIRYVPEGTRAKSVSAWFQYQRVRQNNRMTVSFESGSERQLPPSTDMISDRPIPETLRPLIERLFQKLEGGSSLLMKTGMAVHHKDGIVVGFNATIGLAEDVAYTKDLTDLHIEKFTIGVGGSKKVDYEVCATSIRNWNKPPSYVFSKDVLYMTEDDLIKFGQTCEQSKIRFKAKVYRDESAAQYALNSPSGRECQEDLRKGLKYGTPECTEARILDQTYNVYELSAETENVPEETKSWFNSFRNWFNHKVYPFVVEHKRVDNPPNKFAWTIKRNPANGDSDFKLVRPTEVLVARQVRDAVLPISGIHQDYWSFYPLSAGKNIFRDFVNVTTAGVSEAECFVTKDSVNTFDDVAYNYTLNECDHVLVTDCWKNSKIAVLARQSENRKIVTILSGPDVIKIDPYGTVTINGVENKLRREARFEIRHENDVKVVVYSVENGAVVEMKDIQMRLKVQGSHITVTGPRMLRGRTCGVCGDYNQEVAGEFKTPNRCSLSSGELMAVSFMLKSGEECSSKSSYDIERKLREETEKCHSVDRLIRSNLPDIDLNKETKCTRYAPLKFKSDGVQYPNANCQSTVPSAHCLPGCKPAYMISKPFTFKCSGGDVSEFKTTITIPSSCITV